MIDQYASTFRESLNVASRPVRHATCASSSCYAAQRSVKHYQNCKDGEVTMLEQSSAEIESFWESGGQLASKLAVGS